MDYRVYFDRIKKILENDAELGDQRNVECTRLNFSKNNPICAQQHCCTTQDSDVNFTECFEPLPARRL